MSYVTTLSGGKPQLDKSKAFCTLLENRLPDHSRLFTELIGDFDTAITRRYPVSQGSLNNAHGDWYEWLMALAAWNYYAINRESCLSLLMPNITRFDVVRLYTDDLYDLVTDLRRKVESAASVRLITSNPDFVIIDPAGLEIPEIFSIPIRELNEDAICQIQHAYEHFIGRCSFENIRGFSSIKFTLRPDRRLQIPHEGSLMKAIYTHLQTRKWIISPKGLKYYAICSDATDADFEALKTVATHSITTVHSMPQAAVDEVFVVNSLNEANTVFEKILCL